MPAIVPAFAAARSPARSPLPVDRRCARSRQEQGLASIAPEKVVRISTLFDPGEAAFATRTLHRPEAEILQAGVTGSVDPTPASGSWPTRSVRSGIYLTLHAFLPVESAVTEEHRDRCARCSDAYAGRPSSDTRYASGLTPVVHQLWLIHANDSATSGAAVTSRCNLVQAREARDSGDELCSGFGRMRRLTARAVPAEHEKDVTLNQSEAKGRGRRRGLTKPHPAPSVSPLSAGVPQVTTESIRPRPSIPISRRPPGRLLLIDENGD